MDILVLGGTGFVGPFVVRRLVDLGHGVTLFHRGRTETPLTAGATHVHDDFARLRDHALRADVVVDVNPGIDKGGLGFLHVAAPAVVLTSMDVYRAMAVLWGEEDVPQPMPVDEDAELRSRRSPDLTPDLAFDNLDVERAAADAAFPVTVLRLPVVYGPRDTQRRLRAYVGHMRATREPLVVHPGIRISRGYVENVADVVALVATDDRAAGRTYNVGEPDALTEIQWAREIASAAEWDGEVRAGGAAPLAQDLVGDTSRIRSELGYRESVSRAEGLRRAIEWERAQ